MGRGCKAWEDEETNWDLSLFNIESVSTSPQLTSTYCKPSVPCETTG